MLQIQVIEDLTTEPVTLSEAKQYLQIDYTDFDDLLNNLIKVARVSSEKNSGLAYGPKTIQITGNSQEDKIYPIGPIPSDSVVDWSNTDGNKNYRYKAGFGIADETGSLPLPLKDAILKRVASAFLHRENETTSFEFALNSSQGVEIMYRSNYVV